MTQQNIIIKSKSHSVILLAIVALLMAALLFTLFRGCKNEKAAIANQKEISNTVKNLQADKIELIKKMSVLEKDAKATDTLIEYLIKDKEDAEAAVIDAQDRAIDLAKKVKASELKKDTPALVKDCSELADAAFLWKNKYDGLALRVDSTIELCKTSMGLKDKIIDGFKKAYYSCMDSVNKIGSLNAALKVTGKLKVGVSGMFGPVNGAGPVIAYQDKRNRDYIGSVKFTNYGKVYEATVLMPISLRRKR